MFVKQVSVFVENKKGCISDCIDVLAKANIDISALSVADTDTFGILRLIVNNPDKAYETLKDNNYTCKITRVIGVYIKDVPGGLAKVLNIIKESNIDVNYLYAFVGKEENNEAIVMMRFNEDEKALEVLKKNNIKLVNPSSLYN